MAQLLFTSYSLTAACDDQCGHTTTDSSLRRHGPATLSTRNSSQVTFATLIGRLYISRNRPQVAAAVRRFALKDEGSNYASHDQHCYAQQRHPTSKDVVALVAPLHFLARELFVSYRFVHYDLLTTVAPCFVLTLVTHLKATGPTPPLWQCLGSSIVWMWLYVYAFTLANQIHGSMDGEDAVNKPTRPIPSGHVTPQGASVRLCVVTLLFLGVGYALKLGRLSALWTTTAFVLEFSPLCKGPWHWLAKPIAMGIGSFVQCAGNLSLVRAIDDPRSLLYISAISLGCGISSGIQDLRDMEGDKAKGTRRTLPSLVGEMPARYLSNVFILSFWGIMHATLAAVSGLRTTSCLLTSATILVWCLVISYRTLSMRTPTEDHKTYMIFVYLYCFLLSSFWIL